jgi:CRISPR-associated endonuclease/helicase Cas3
MKASIWPDWLDHIWAKSPEQGEGGEAESLAQHTWYVLQRLNEFIELRPGLPDQLGVPRLWHVLFWAAFLHDFGKAAEGFQAWLRGGPRWPHRHEVFSLAFVDWLSSGLSEDERLWLIAAIVSHHKDASDISLLYSPPDDPDDDQVARRIAEFGETTLRGLWRWLTGCSRTWAADLKLIGAEITALTFLPEEEAVTLVQQNGADHIYTHLKSYRRFVRTLNRSEEQELIIGTLALRGHLINADHSASAHAGALPRPHFDTDAILASRDLTWNHLFKHQGEAAQVEGSALLTAPTGSGKTEAALLWAAHQAGTGSKAPRLFYTLPYQASMNAMQLRLSETFGARYVGLQHGRSLLALYRLLLEREYDPNQAMRHAKWARNLSQLNYQPVRVFSPYQMLKGMYRLKGYEALLTDYHNALFIFDEIHAYEVKRLALILKTIEYLAHNYRARFLVMSATFPTLIKDWLKDALGNPAEVNAESSAFAAFRRHHLRLLDGELLSDDNLGRIVTDAQAGKSVLVVCNTVDRAQTAYRELDHCLEKVGIPVALLHGRFNMQDRSDKEKLIREATGKDESKRRPVVLVATQAVEVSLDIDLDTIYTDPAPLEALVQRFGRVNRRRKQKDLAPVHVFLTPDDGQGIYDESLVARTLSILKREQDKAVDEEKIGTWLDEIYTGDVAARWQQEYALAAREFEAICIQPLRAFNADEGLEEAFYKAFDGTEVLPASLQNEYEVLQKDDPIRAAELLVPISYGRLWQVRNAGRMVSQPGIWPPVVDVAYDSMLGLDFSSVSKRKL